MSRRSEILEDITLSKDDWDKKTAAAGHAMDWELEREYLCWYGACSNCGAGMSVFQGGTSAGRTGFQCARDVPCRGPGTAWQDEMQMDLAMERLNGAVSEFGQAVKDVYDREWLGSQGL